MYFGQCLKLVQPRIVRHFWLLLISSGNPSLKSQQQLGNSNVLITRRPYGWIIFRLCLQTCGSESSNRLAGPGPQWTLVPRDYSEYTLHIHPSTLDATARASLSIDLTSICPQKETKDHSASLRWCVVSMSKVPLVLLAI